MANCDVSVNVIKKVSVGTAALEAIGLLLAVFRLWFRFRIRRLWWEDAWAFAAFVFATNYLIGSWLYVHSEKPTSTVGCWVSILTSNVVIWLVRLSTLFSVARNHLSLSDAARNGVGDSLDVFLAVYLVYGSKAVVLWS